MRRHFVNHQLISANKAVCEQSSVWIGNAVVLTQQCFPPLYGLLSLRKEPGAPSPFNVKACKISILLYYNECLEINAIITY